MSAFATMDDASLAATISAMRDGIADGNTPLRDSPMPAFQARLRRRRLALGYLEKAEEALRFGGETPLPNTDLPAVDEPRVPRRPPLGGDPMRPLDGSRLPSGRYHP
ncbi:hypothetical protein ABEV34_27245 [Methylorubrum rhodesianum]|uniref:hypothetical protein n=1 Tax=Methylorubrum TaxID=2282523 RepID=UPI00129C486D|nr:MULTISPECIES: hypothetical protein [Methylorubrum]MBB5765661.1 hypothetical protein [Methylorubrum rhodesianum]MBI1691566.1 hypothetical protein [Methylorubrum sp. DB1722]MRI57388.1 hypothetical protein [Methylobacterium sp. DB1607]